MFRVAFHSTYVLPLPEGHRFPMIKYELIPLQLEYEGTLEPNSFFHPSPLNFETAALVHTPEYLNRLLSLSLTSKEIRRSGFPLTKELISREFLIAGGTVSCCDFAFETGISFNVAGGTHHAFADRAEGFCLLNDCAIAAAHLLSTGKAKKILIIDLDVHQGNGTAVIFKNNPRVFTFSMHGASNFPLEKENSDLDIALPDGVGDEAYLNALNEALLTIRSTANFDFIFYVAGADVLETDKLGRLKLSRSAAMERDRRVMAFAHSQSIPMVVTMGGGYSEKIKDIVEAHCNTFRVAREMY
jgi:acetoin utilization deacetylase AcuC-like enzyme